jgi:hypothetical protein
MLMIILAILAVVLLFGGIAGIRLARLAPSKSKPKLAATEPKLSDARLLNIIEEEGGKISLAKLCMRSGLSVADAQKRLDALTEQGIFSMEVDEKGVVFYELLG